MFINCLQFHYDTGETGQPLKSVDTVVVKWGSWLYQVNLEIPYDDPVGKYFVYCSYVVDSLQ